MDKRNNSGDLNSGDLNSGNLNSGDRNSGHLNSGNWNSGHLNSGAGNSGCFNSITPKILFFNKETEVLRENINIPFFPILCEWIEESKMTDAEKKDNPKFFVCGGYLKKYDYKAACKTAWNKMADTDKEIVKTLPNFDSVIFYDITGIEVSADTDKMKKEMIAEAEKLLVAGNELLKRAKGMI